MSGKATMVKPGAVLGFNICRLQYSGQGWGFVNQRKLIEWTLRSREAKGHTENQSLLEHKGGLLGGADKSGGAVFVHFTVC